jgi:hypothetical protein
MLSSRRVLVLGKLSEIGRETFFTDSERKNFEEISGYWIIRTVREGHSLVSADNGKRPPKLLVGKEVFDADIENHGDASEGWQGRNEFPVLQLGQHRCRQACVLPEVDQRDLLSKPELPQFCTNLIRAYDATNGLLAAFSVHGSVFTSTYNMSAVFDVTEIDFSITRVGSFPDVESGIEA